jgi:hypothetical protein
MTPQQRDLIIRTIAAESSGKTPEEGQGIAHVIMNRIMSGRYGRTPERVLFAPKQFEPWADPRGSNYPMRHKPGTTRYEKAQDALEAAMGGDDITGGATLFWGPKSQAALGRPAPKWGRTGGLDIGETRFHRDDGGMVEEREAHGKGSRVVAEALDALRGGRKIFPKPQRMFPEGARPPGGEYLDAATGEAITGQKPARAVIGVTPEGKPVFLADTQQVDVTGSPGPGSTKTKTNLFKQQAGWKWNEAPEGYSDASTLVSAENRGQHYYGLGANFPKGVDLERYANATSEPRLRPTTQGNVYPGQQVGSIDVRGREHPVYDMLTIRNLLAGTGAAGAGAAAMPDEGAAEPIEREPHAGGKRVVDSALDYIRGWHGSGKQFKAFDPNKMGTGAGEMYGRGAYIAKDEDLARKYREMQLYGKDSPKIGKVPFQDLYDLISKGADKLPAAEGQPFYNRLAILEDAWGGDKRKIADTLAKGEYDPAAMQWFNKEVAPKLWTPGGLYEVGIKAKPEQFMHWMNPLREQSPFIQDIMRPKAIEIADTANQARAAMLNRGKDFMGRPYPPVRMEAFRQIVDPETIPGVQLYGQTHRDFNSIRPQDWQPEANQQLRDKGIVGNVYRDTAPSGGPTENFVVYDPVKDIDILNRYASGGEVSEGNNMDSHIARALYLARGGYATPGFVDDQSDEEYSDGARPLTIYRGERPDAAAGPVDTRGPTSHARYQAGLGQLGRFEDVPPMDPAVMGENWANAVKNYRNSPRREGEPTMSARTPSMREQIGDFIAGDDQFNMASTIRQRLAQLAVGEGGQGGMGVGALDFVPFAGGALNATDISHQLGEGDYLGAGISAAMTALPFAGRLAKPAMDYGRRAVDVAKQYAPQAGAAVGAGAVLAPEEAEAAKAPKIVQQALRAIRGNDLIAKDPRIADVVLSKRDLSGSDKLGMRASDVEYSVRPKNDLRPWQRFNPEDMFREQGYVVPALGDRSAAGRKLEEINGVKLTSPSDQQGGGEFKRSTEDPAVWASRTGMVTSMQGQLDRAMAAQGVPQGAPVFMSHTLMGYPSLDSTHMMAEAILRQVKPTMGKIDPKAAEKVDAFIRASYPQWPGILNPAEAEAFLKHKEVGKRTSTILQALDKADPVRGGLPNLGAARLAVMDPRLVSADQLSSGFAISRLDPNARGTSVRHGTYTSPMLGDYRGGTDYQIPANLMFPDWYKGMNPEFLEKKSGLMKPTSPTMFQHGLMMQFPLQKTTQEWLDNIMAHTEREGKKWGYREGGVVYE